MGSLCNSASHKDNSGAHVTFFGRPIYIYTGAKSSLDLMIAIGDALYGQSLQ